MLLTRFRSLKFDLIGIRFIYWCCVVVGSVMCVMGDVASWAGEYVKWVSVAVIKSGTMQTELRTLV